MASSLCLRFINPTIITPLSHSRALSSPRRRLSLLVNRRSFSISATMASSAKKVLVPIANGTEPLEAVVMIDVLRGRGGTQVTVASVEKQLQVDACHGVKIVADSLLSDCSDAVFDLITLPGGLPGGETLKNCGVLENMVKKQDAEGRLNGAICCAPALALGSWGLLKGRKATCYPVFMEQLASCATAVESRVQIDGKILTSRGPGTTMEFSVSLVEQLYGKEKANEVAGPLLLRPNPGGEYTITELNQTRWTFDGTPQILVPIADGSEEMEAVAIVDLLRRAKAKVVMAAVGDSLEVVASRKVKLVADVLLDDAERLTYDLIVLPGGLGGAQAFASCEKLVNMLKKQAESNKPYGAICASPALVLEPHGLLKGKKATAFPAMCEKLSDKSHIEHRVVVDGNLVTSRGPGTSMEFALAIIEKFFGREKGLEIAKATLL
ncbi:PREDICTED: LOW QUALITY PROTEIN: protein DJ-1 homolog B-like [Tarenaya hassleriana]|uniref:LOW QUALITY PROTEIN: protein DJ-1 homolog B-like n=1 Tax=Tarenaya hassleriana TaxID=28532 RepID=UPI00053CA376|nr:PREDICTED: LOW QUALITY PROTEIN: protein DJ-1 homolog B-like [Tarenaya hassleriana]